MVEEGPWAPVEGEQEDEGTDADASAGRDRWDYAAYGVGLLILAIAIVVVIGAFGGGGDTTWSLDVRGELGEHEEAVVVTDDDVVRFDAAVGFVGKETGDRAENVQVRAVDRSGRTLAVECIGTLHNDRNHRFQQFQFDLTQEPDRVLVEATAIHNGSTRYFVRGWTRDQSVFGGRSSLRENRSTYINSSACGN